MTDHFAAAIADLSEDDPEQNIASIKNAVIAQLQASDDRVEVETTEYFNHTYAPDLILRWNTGRPDRRVYLRTNTNPVYLLEDVNVVSANHPILIPLRPVEHAAETIPLGEHSAAAQTLIADPSTFQALGTERKSQPIGHLLSRAVLQGGRGLVDSDRARSVGGTMTRAFSGAQRAEAQVTREAIDTAEGLLDPVQADQITRLFQALWLGSGAPATAFPGATSLTTTLDATALQLLLDVAVSDDDQFWRRIGSGLTLDLLCEVNASSESQSLQRLVNLSSDHLRARICQVIERGDAAFEQSGLRWSVGSGLLGLEGANFRAYFSPNSASEAHFPESFEIPGIGILELLTRARLNNVEIGELEFETTAGRLVDYKGASGTDIAGDDVLQNLGSVLGPQFSVRTAAALLGGGARQLRCDFKTRTASGRTGAKFSLSEMLSTAVPLLTALAENERTALGTIIAHGMLSGSGAEDLVLILLAINNGCAERWRPAPAFSASAVM